RTHAAAGALKAEALAEAAARLFCDTEFLPLILPIADVGLRHLVHSDIIFGCVDNDLARLEMAYLANKLKIPVIDGGLGTPNYSHGRVSYFPGDKSACYGCGLSERKRRELLTLWDGPASSCWGDLPTDSGRVFPSSPTMAAIIGSMQVEVG